MVKTRSSSRLRNTSYAQREASAESKDDQSLERGVQEIVSLAVTNLKKKASRIATAPRSAVVAEADGQSSSALCEGNVLPDVLFLDPKSSRTKSSSSSRSRTKTSKHVDYRDVSHCARLASSLDPGISEGLYFNLSTESTSPHQALPTCKTDKLMERSLIGDDFEKRETVPLLHPSRRKLERSRKAEQQKTTGPQWFNMAAPEVTQELKNDLKVLQMRGAMERSQHYRASDWKKALPKHFQVGTVVEGAAEFYSARVPKKLRRKTLVEELLADEQFKKYHKKKYLELQHRFQTTARRKYRNKKTI